MKSIDTAVETLMALETEIDRLRESRNSLMYEIGVELLGQKHPLPEKKFLVKNNDGKDVLMTVCRPKSTRGAYSITFESVSGLKTDGKVETQAD